MTIDADDPDVLVDIDSPGDVASGASAITVCIERWRNAGPDDRKRMWQMFAETGIFLAACRHGFILLICDMIQSGDLYAVVLLHLQDTLY
jgi:Kyakuja-Dileera-Zisupton transposase